MVTRFWPKLLCLLRESLISFAPVLARFPRPGGGSFAKAQASHYGSSQTPSLQSRHLVVLPFPRSGFQSTTLVSPAGSPNLRHSHFIVS
jgi:hypothetical protein